MGFIRNAIKSGIAIKAVNIIQREAAKPENQRKARAFVQKLRTKGAR
jgi:hypothetical protein